MRPMRHTLTEAFPQFPCRALQRGLPGGCSRVCHVLLPAQRPTAYARCPPPLATACVGVTRNSSLLIHPSAISAAPTSHQLPQVGQAAEHVDIRALNLQFPTA